jgi:hypothetical protein
VGLQRIMGLRTRRNCRTASTDPNHPSTHGKTLGGHYVGHHRNDSNYLMALRDGQFIHPERLYSHLAGRCRDHPAGPRNPRYGVAPQNPPFMKTSTIVGLILLVCGILSFIYKGITYKTEEKILDIGPIQATAEETKTIPIQPYLGAALIVGGSILLATSLKKH